MEGVGRGGDAVRTVATIFMKFKAWPQKEKSCAGAWLKKHEREGLFHILCNKTIIKWYYVTLYIKSM